MRILPLQSGGGRCLDLGCGAGVIILLLKAREMTLRVSGVEILQDAADAARENMRLNHMEAEIITGDLRDRALPLRAGGFDLVVSNPPYFALDEGKEPPDAGRASARGERHCSISELCSAGAYYCKNGGRFAMVHRPERLCEVFAALHSTGLEPKRLRLVQHGPNIAPCLALVEARRGGGKGLAVLPALLLHDENGGESAEFRRIYRMEKEWS